MRKLLDLWLKLENHKESYYISKNKQRVLDKRIVSIKPISEITRKPRSLIDHRADFKENELRSLSLYYLRHCLIDILLDRYITHFQLLSASIYMLLQKNISLRNISLAESMLKDFVDSFEKILWTGQHNNEYTFITSYGKQCAKFGATLVSISIWF